MTNGRCWDLVVAGGGPAGSVAALAALQERPGAAVLILHQAPTGGEKPCGGGVPDGVWSYLEGLRVPRPAEFYSRSFPALIVAPGKPRVSRISSPGFDVFRRRDFDRYLLSAALERGAVLRATRVSSVECASGAVVINGDIRARALVGADGAESASATATRIVNTSP